MKKLLLLIILLLLCINVYAEQLDEYEPVDQKINVESKSLRYINLQLKDGNIVIEGIENISKKKIPISFAIALFDDVGSNIGMINYCSKEDIQSDYSAKELYKNEKIAFSMPIKSDYFGSHGKKKYTFQDIEYYALINDNMDCKIGSATRYIGMSYDEIMDGYSNDSKKPTPKDPFFIIFIVGGGLFVLWVIANIIYRSGVVRRRKQRFKTYSAKLNESTTNDNNNASQFFQKVQEEKSANPEQNVEKKDSFIQTDVVAQNEEENKKEDNSSDLMNLYK